MEKKIPFRIKLFVALMAIIAFCPLAFSREDSDNIQVLEIGKVPSARIYEMATKGSGIVWSSADISLTSYDIFLNDIKYTFVVREDKIVYIDTQDKNFKTSEGVTVGLPLSEVVSISNSKLAEERGWAFFVSLPSGWNAAFSVGDTMTDESPLEDAPVEWLFKRR